MARVTALSIEGAWLVETPVHHDNRGHFQEWFKESLILQAIGREFDVAQVNISRSKRGVVRGIHGSKSPRGQAKWVTCTNGTIWDVVVDIRPESPTFMRSEAFELNHENGKSLVISEGLGHAFLSLQDDSVTTYALSSEYDSSSEFAINPQDRELAIEWPSNNLIFSERDLKAPTLKEFLSS